MGFEKKVIIRQNLNDQRFGYFVRYNRCNKQISLNTLANIVGISPSYLSDIEHGKKRASDYTKSRICKKLNIVYSINKDIGINIHNYIHQIVNSFIRFQIQDIKNIYDEINLNYDYYYNSCFFSELFLIVYLSETILKISVSKIENFDEMFSFLDHNEYYVYKVFLSYHTENINWKSALIYYEEALLLSSTSSYKILDGWMYSKLAELYLNSGMTYESLQCSDKALSLLQAECATKRLLNALIIKGNALSEINRYELAVECIDKVINESKAINDISLLDLGLNNLCSCALINKKYEDLIYYANEAINIKSHSPYLYFYLIWSCIKLNKIENAEKYLQLSCNTSNKKVNLLLSLCGEFVKDGCFNKGTIDKCNEIVKVSGNVAEEKIMKEILIDYFLNRKDYQSAFKISIHI